MKHLLNDVNFLLFALICIAVIALLVSSVRCKGKGYLLAFVALILLASVSGYLPYLFQRIGLLKPDNFDLRSAQPFFAIMRMIGWTFLLMYVASLRFAPPDTASADGRPSGNSMTIRKALFSFEGRLSRADYWDKGVLPLLPVSVTNTIMAYGMEQDWAHQIAMIIGVLSLWPGLALIIKRLHDRDKSGWYALVMLIPVVGVLIITAEVWFMKGTAGANRFGPAPLPQAPTPANNECHLAASP